jgi:hypothetical protein
METIFSRLRSMETQGQPLHALIVEACDVGDDCVEAIEDMLRRVRSRIQMRERMPGDVNETLALELTAMLVSLEDEARAALARAYVNNGHTPDNGKAAA